jgi:hypothetical protein
MSNLEVFSWFILKPLALIVYIITWNLI